MNGANQVAAPGCLIGSVELMEPCQHCGCKSPESVGMLFAEDGNALALKCARCGEWMSRPPSPAVEPLANPFRGVFGTIPAALTLSTNCPKCGAIATEAYHVTVVTGSPDPGLVRCPSGHIFGPKSATASAT